MLVSCLCEVLFEGWEIGDLFIYVVVDVDGGGIDEISVFIGEEQCYVGYVLGFVEVFEGYYF